MPRCVCPGFVNAHSHAFQRALRGRVEHVDPDHPHDDFWTWREAMYQAANAIDPDGAYEVALLLYREMVAAGYTAVGEFHYPHHQPGGEPYPDPNAMAKATAAAAARRRHRDRDADDRVRAGRRRLAADRGPAPLLRSRRRRPTWHGWRRWRREMPRRPGAAQRAGGAARLAGGDHRLRGVQRHGRAHPRQRAAARDRRVPGRVRPAADRAAGRDRAARPARHASSTPPTSPSASSSCWPRPVRPSAPARPPRPTSATASCRRSS